VFTLRKMLKIMLAASRMALLARSNCLERGCVERLGSDVAVFTPFESADKSTTRQPRQCGENTGFCHPMS